MKAEEGKSVIMPVVYLCVLKVRCTRWGLFSEHSTLRYAWITSVCWSPVLVCNQTFGRTHNVCFCFPVLFLYKRSVLVLRLGLVRYSILRGCCVVIGIISCHKVNRKQNVFIAMREDNGMFWQWSWVIVALWVWVVKLVFQFLSLVLCIYLNTVKKNNLTGRKYLSVFTWLFHQTWIILVHNS